MSDSDNSGLAVLALIVAAVLGYSAYKDYKEENSRKKKIKQLEEKFREFDCEKFLDPGNKLHRGLMNTVNELRDMLIDSLIEMEETPIFRYPIATGMLMRSSVEQAIKVYIDSNGAIVDMYAYKNEKTMAKILENKKDEKSQKLMVGLRHIMNQEVRDALNDMVHSPEDIEKIEKTVIELSIATPLLEFVKDAASMVVWKNQSP